VRPGELEIMTLQELIDRGEIAELVSRLGLWLDEKRFDEARSILTEEATAKAPGGSVAGVDQVAEQARRNHMVPTQHVITNVLIDLEGDRATVGANLIATFVDGPDPSGPLFQRGERYTFEVVRTADGWRLSQVESKPIWSIGPRDPGARSRASSGAETEGRRISWAPISPRGPSPR
jgi:SnoaL-like domain